MGLYRSVTVGHEISLCLSFPSMMYMLYNLELYDNSVGVGRGGERRGLREERTYVYYLVDI